MVNRATPAGDDPGRIQFSQALLASVLLPALNKKPSMPFVRWRSPGLGRFMVERKIMNRLRLLVRRIQARSVEFDNDVIVLHKHKCIYVPIPKVACSSIMSACADILEVKFPESEWKPELFQTNKWDHLFDRQSVIMPKSRASAYTEYWKFAFVRNPWDRLLSCYSEKIREDGDKENFTAGVSNILLPFGVFRSTMSFEEFARTAVAIADDIADPHWRSQNTFACQGSRLWVDFVGRFESVERDFQLVCQRIGTDCVLPHLLRSDHKIYRECYSDALCDLVARRYRRDIDMFGYQF